jgi:PAS domain S-box-containing protein
MRPLVTEQPTTDPKIPAPDSTVRLLFISQGSSHPAQPESLFGSFRRVTIDYARAESLPAGLDLLDKEEFDVLLVEVPAGRDADIEAVRAFSPGARSVPLVAIGGEANPGQEQAALNAGADDYLNLDDLSPALLERSILYAIERLRSTAVSGRNEGSYEELLDSLGGIVWEGDAQTFEFTFVNKQAERLLGYPVERWTTEPTFWQDHMHPDDREWATQFCAIATAQRRAHEFEYRMIAADGRVVWLRDIVTVVVENGRPVKLRGVMVDATAKKRAENDLTQKEEQYRGVFEATSDGLVIIDDDGNVVEVNPAFCAMHGYTHEEMIGIDPRRFVHPDSHDKLAQFFETVRSGQQFFTRAMDVRKDGTAFNVEVHGTRFMYKGQPHILGVVIDITEQARACELLEQRVAERTQELSTLLEISNNVASTLELKPLLNKILEQLKFVANYSRAAILVLDGEELITLDARADGEGHASFARRRFALNQGGALWQTLLTREPVIVPDVQEDNDNTQAYSRAISELLAANPSVKSWMAVPLVLHDKVVGLLSLSYTEPGYYTPRHARLAMTVANQATIAIENARLYEQAQETAHKTAALAQSASQVAYGGDLQTTLDMMCRHVVDVTGASAAAVVLRDPETGLERMIGSHGLPDGYAGALNDILATGVPLILQDAFSGRKPMFRRGMRESIATSEAYAPLHRYMEQVEWDMVVAVPMIYRDVHAGVLLSYHPPTSKIGEAELTFHTIIADQAAVAVENARLLNEARDKAGLEERQRLARELHDSVTQALFSMSLIARSAEMMMLRENTPPAQILEKLSDLRQLTQGALAEMRALIFELRPGALEEEGLVEALRKHAAAIQGRELLPVQLVVDPEQTIPRLKPAAEEALYRISQEAVHNVVKHARATQVEIRVGTRDGNIVLEVQDNGSGFNTDSVPAGHMGLGTMRERAEALGGQYIVRSAPGEGTTITVLLPLAEWQLPEANSNLPG